MLIWDNLNVHLKAELRAFTDTQAWLRVFRLPAYAPDLNPVEGIWSVLKRGDLANLAVASFGHLVQVIRHGLKKIQYRPTSSKADQPGYHRIGRHRPSQIRLPAQHRDIGQAVPAQRQRGGQVRHDLARVMHRPRRPPRLQGR